MKSIKCALAILVAVGLVACGDGHDHHHHGHDDHHHHHGSGSGHGHHTAPHGGTLVVVGKEAAHLEFVLDAEGNLTAYILDAHAENGVRIKQEEIALTVTVGDKTHQVALKAKEVALTKEKPGDTSEFGALVPELKGVKAFQAEIASVTIKGATFAKVAFPFPEGNEATAHGSH